MIRIGIVGTGGMAGGHAEAFRRIRGCKLVAACDIHRKVARAFARRYGIAEVYTDIDEMLASSEIDAVSNATPDAAHASTSLKAIALGKHIFCEKPLATNYPDARKMAAAARRKGVINMVNLSYRNGSAIHKARRLVEGGAIGTVLHVAAHYLQSWLACKAWGDYRKNPAMLWRLSKKHGSMGALGDLGVHLIDFVTLAAGDIKSVNCRLKTFPKGRGERIGPYRFDANDSAAITAEFASGALGVIHATRWATGHTNSIKVSIHGKKGAIVVDLDEGPGVLRICRGPDVDKARWRTVKCGKVPDLYHRFIRSIRSGKNEQPDFTRAAAVQKVLSACFASDETGKAVKV